MTSSVNAGLAAVVRRFGPPEVIGIELVNTPTPGPGQVRLRVQAAGVGPWDVQVRSGKSPVPRSLPLVIGAELAGVVETVGFGVSSVAVGDVVYGVTNPFHGGPPSSRSPMWRGSVSGPPCSPPSRRGGPGRRLHGAPDGRARRHLGRDATFHPASGKRRSVDDAARLRGAPRWWGGAEPRGKAHRLGARCSPPSCLIPRSTWC
jgi:hypothetical protein